MPDGYRTTEVRVRTFASSKSIFALPGTKGNRWILSAILILANVGATTESARPFKISFSYGQNENCCIF
jgi:hypothetical protein